MRKEHVRFVREEILFIHHTLHTKKDVCVGYIVCYYRARVCILRVWEYSMGWLDVDICKRAVIFVTFEAIDQLLDMIGSDWPKENDQNE